MCKNVFSEFSLVQEHGLTFDARELQDPLVKSSRELGALSLHDLGTQVGGLHVGGAGRCGYPCKNIIKTCNY